MRYTTEEVANTFSGAFEGAAKRLAPAVTAFTELRVEGGEFVAVGEFSLELPLPRWWPIPDGTMALGERLIRGLVEKDTQLTVERIRAECQAWERAGTGRGGE